MPARVKCAPLLKCIFLQRPLFELPLPSDALTRGKQATASSDTRPGQLCRPFRWASTYTSVAAVATRSEGTAPALRTPLTKVLPLLRAPGTMAHTRWS